MTCNQPEKLIFLDIDGVLNGHYFMIEAQSCTISPEPVKNLNRILRETRAKIILSSAWRYMIGPDMSLRGFMNMLRTHGVRADVDIIGMTERDEVCAHCSREIKCDEECGYCAMKTTRADQVWKYLSGLSGPKRYVVIDDCDFGFTEGKLHFVDTDSCVGLTEPDAARVITILNGSSA